jgi:hypothetical protein
MVRVVAHLRRQIEGHAQAAHALARAGTGIAGWIPAPSRTRRTAASSRAGPGTSSAECRG